jgi:integrase
MPRVSSNPATQKNAYGSVLPYTRHLSTCKKKSNCSCPKWLYEHRKGHKPRRYTLNTPSWAEAQQIAAKRLRSFDPDIEAAQAIVTKAESGRRTIEEACQLWMQRTKREFGEKSGIVSQYKSLTKKFATWAAKHRIEYIQDVTPEQLENWYSCSDWTRYSPNTRNQRWKVMRSVFKFWVGIHVLTQNPIVGIEAVSAGTDHVQGPYTDKQIAAIFAHVDDEMAPNTSKIERDVYTVRLRAFITLLLHTGCDLIDGVLFNKSRLERVTLGKQHAYVYRYRRAKTGITAVIPIDPKQARLLLNAPEIEGCPADMPFRFSDAELNTNAEMWRYRIQTVLDAANVKWVTLPPDELGNTRRKPANIKQFRHTFAVTQLVAGQREEAVAKMLGHADTVMLRRHYKPWVKSLDDAHVLEVLKVRAAK